MHFFIVISLRRFMWVNHLVLRILLIHHTFASLIKLFMYPNRLLALGTILCLLILFPIGFHNSSCDTSLFIHHTSTSLTFVLVYVDDILITWNNSSHIASLIQQLNYVFALKDLGPISYFLSISWSYSFMVFPFTTKVCYWYP